MIDIRHKNFNDVNSLVLLQDVYRTVFSPPPNLYARQGVGAFENSLLSQGELSKDYEWIDLLL